MVRKGVVLAAAMAAVLSACGGGGGGGSEGPYSLSGTISVAESSAVDSDLNDVLQSNRSQNNSPNAAQPIETPVTLVGTVNLANTGPAGATRAGDPNDYFSVALVAGQVVELEAAADMADADLDLYVLSLSQTQLGFSAGQTSRFECITITRNDNYYVHVTASRGASTYNLRIGAPGSAGNCPQSATAASFDPTQLLAQPKAQAVDAAQTVQRNAGVTPLSQSAGPQLLQLPSTASLRRQGLQALSKSVAGSSAGVSTTNADTDEDPPTIVALKYAKALQATGAYDYVQPNWIMQRLALTGTFPPSDPRYVDQRWHYELINLPSAMARIDAAGYPVTRQRPVVAVVDEGVMLDHPDLQPQFFSNGRAFVTSPSDTGNRASGDDVSTAANNPTFHGTHVAGTIAAQTFDAYGGAGVAPMAQILPLRVFTPGSSGASSLDVIQAMRYAAGLSNSSNTLPSRRADVINLSLGSDRACDSAYASVVREIRAQGTVVVAASGNSNGAPVGSPANCDGIISVGAVDAQRGIASYSNIGSALSLVAPGGDGAQFIYSDIGRFLNSTRQPFFGGQQGTSMATPHVSGVVALMRYINPDLSPGQIDTLLTGGALTDDLGTAGRDSVFGWGLINADKAAAAAFASTSTPVTETPVLVVASPSVIDFGSFQSSATFTLSADTGNSETVVSIASSNAAITVSAVNSGVNRGLGTYTVTVNRTSLPVGTSFESLAVTLTPSRTLTVPLSITKLAVNTGPRVGNLGPIYVLLIDPDDIDPDGRQKVVQTILATPGTSGYTWSAVGYNKSRVWVVAGGDPDNDGIVCQPGEPCGELPTFTLTGNRADLNFQVTPLSSISTQSVAPGGQGWRRTQLTTP